MSQSSARVSAIFLALCLALLTPHAVSALDQDVSYARIVRLSYADGDVQVNRPEESGWQQAMLNLPIKQGYQIATGQGRAEIEFESGAVARLAENTTLQFNELSLIDGGRVTHLTLSQGTATFYANLSGGDRFIVSTAHFDVGVPRNSRFRVDSGNDGATVTVLKGDVSVDHRGEAFRVTKNRSLLLNAVDDRVQIARAPEMDSWDRWVEDRENVLTSSREAALHYTRAPVSYGMADLYNYGGWSTLSGYGSCWRPFGVGLGWSPYWNGQWMFLTGFGWTWVSYEPWGWLPYHYGNWVWTPSGWYWVPGGFHQWRPAIVYWVNLGGNRWGWGPLAPHDRPGQPPANLPHGTVTTNNTPRGYSGVDRRFENPRVTMLNNSKIAFETPEDINEVLRARRSPGNRSGTEAPSATTPTVPATGVAPAAGFSGRTNTAQPRGVTPEDREPRVRGRAGDPGPASTIIYDRNERRYVNNPAAPTRPGPPERVDNPERPAAVSPRGYSGTPAAHSNPSQPPAGEMRRTDRPNDMNRLPGRSGDFDRPAPARPSSPQPRYESQPRQQYSPPARAEQPRYSPPASSSPRMEAPRPAPQPRMEAPRPAPAPTPRAEPRENPRRPPH